MISFAALFSELGVQQQHDFVLVHSPNSPSHGLSRPRLLSAASGDGATGGARSGGSVASPLVKRLLALLAGGLGLGALLRRRRPAAAARLLAGRRAARCGWPSRGPTPTSRSRPPRRRSPTRPPMPTPAGPTCTPARGTRSTSYATRARAPSSSSRSASVRPRSGGAHVLAASARRAATTSCLQRGVPREALDGGAQRARRGRVAAPHGVDDHLGKRRCQPRDRPGCARGESLADQRLGADEDVEPVEQVRLDLLERRVAHLHARPGSATVRATRSTTAGGIA